MIKKSLIIFSILLAVVALQSCDENKPTENNEKKNTATTYEMKKYAKVQLTADISHLSDNQKGMLRLLFNAADIMDNIFWQENVGKKKAFLGNIEDKKLKKYARINYGPWDELNNLAPFIDGYKEKPPGAQFYPADMTKEEFEAFDHPDKTSLYTLVRRDKQNKLKIVWYHEAFKKQVQKASVLLKQAAELAEDEGFKNYLNLRAEAMLNDDYFASDMAWLSMKSNLVDIVVGPIENYTDGLYGYKAAHESFILIKDVEWSARLAKYATFLPQLQKELPVDPVYKKETPGSDVDLNAYDVVYTVKVGL